MRKLLKYTALLFILVIGYLGYTNFQKFIIISGLSAKWVASGIFVAERTQWSIEESDSDFSPITWAKNEVDLHDKSVSTSVFGLQERKAIYRKGLGTVVTNDGFDPDIPYLSPNRQRVSNNLEFPYGDLPQKDTIFSNVNYDDLEKVVVDYFNENDETNTTRSLLIVYRNQIIAEKYADGFDKDSKMLGWSMSKSILSALYGVMEQQGRIGKDDFAPIESWKNDGRSKITINNLLQMNSGLEWEEDYTKICDVTEMLYVASDMTKTQLKKPLIGKSNETWNYSSGTTNLLSGILRQQLKSHQEYLDFWYAELIDKIGMNSMVLEADLAGNYVASSYAWANTRDWAKFGLLYLNKGNWNGKQILSEDWVKYTATPTNGSKGIYGAQFWLNAGGHLIDVPKDMYMASGYQGQYVFIIPSKELVIVRMGVNYNNTKELLKKRPVKENEIEAVVEFELKNKANNILLAQILSTLN